jgi:hypothetical protein
VQSRETGAGTDIDEVGVTRIEQRKRVDQRALDGLPAMRRRRWMALVDRQKPAPFKKCTHKNSFFRKAEASADAG